MGKPEKVDEELRQSTYKALAELRQLKLALRYLAEQWQEQSSLQAQTLLSLLARIESLAPGSPEKLIKAAVHDAKLDALAGTAWHYSSRKQIGTLRSQIDGRSGQADYTTSSPSLSGAWEWLLCP